MAKNRLEIKEQLNALSNKELIDIVLKLAVKKENYDFLLVNYLDREGGEDELFEKTKSDLNILFSKRYKGFSEELQLANMLNACIKRINEFTKVSKNKVLEADLLFYILEIPFSYSDNMFGTCFTTYDTRVGIILRRLINLITKKMHPDYTIEYKDKINKYLTVLHRTSNHNDTIYKLPQMID